MDCSAPKIVYVDLSRPDGGNSPAENGESWTTAFKGTDALYRALEDPNTVYGSQIWVANGTYKPTTTSTRTLYHNMHSGVSVYGGFHGNTSYDTGGESLLSQRDPNSNLCALSGDVGTGNADSYHVVYMFNVDNSVLDGFTILAGYADGSNDTARGGGIFCRGGQPIISNCKIGGNFAESEGGGTYIKASSAVFTNCEFITNSTDNSTDGYGGGVFSAGSVSEFYNCVWKGNYAKMDGGGLYASDDSNNSNLILITNCTFYSNQARTAAYGGGAVYCEDDVSLITRNSIYWANCAFNGGSCDTSAELHDASSQIHVNSGDRFFEVLYCDVDNNGSALSAPFDDASNIKDDPNFVNPGAGNLRLGGSSPCVDVGSNQYLPCVEVADLDRDLVMLETLPKDRDFNPRRACMTPLVDMGAYERPCGGYSRGEGDPEMTPEDEEADWDCYLDDGTDEELAERCAS